MASCESGNEKGEEEDEEWNNDLLRGCFDTHLLFNLWNTNYCCYETGVLTITLFDTVPSSQK